MARSRVAPALLALPGGLALTAALADGAHRLLAGSTSPAGDPAAAVAGLAAAVATLIAAWLTLCLALALLAELPGAVGDAARQARDRVTPAVVRRWAAVVLGASVTATVLPGTAVAAVRSTPDPGHAAGPLEEPAAPSPGWGRASPAPAPTSLPAPGLTATPHTTPSSSPPSSGPGWAPGSTTRAQRPPATTPGWLPERPVTRQRTDPHLLTGRHRGAGEDRSVAVRRGDTLWSIAAADLGPEATDAEIARAWPRWHAANASTVGSDPHHLLPGTLLTPPTD